jgi:hypothetical protein
MYRSQVLGTKKCPEAGAWVHLRGALQKKSELGKLEKIIYFCKMDPKRMCQCCGEHKWQEKCKKCGIRKGHCCMVVHLDDGICYMCSGPDFPLPEWCKAECEEHQKKKHNQQPKKEQPSTRKDQWVQLGIVGELNRALPKDGKLFYDLELGGNSLMSYTAIEVAIVNEDKSKEYVKMVVNSPLMGKDEIRIMIHEPFKILTVQRPNGEGSDWLLDELFPHLRTSESRLQQWKKPDDSVDREKEQKRDANRDRDASPTRESKSDALEKSKQEV